MIKYTFKLDKEVLASLIVYIKKISHFYKKHRTGGRVSLAVDSCNIITLTYYNTENTKLFCAFHEIVSHCIVTPNIINLNDFMFEKKIVLDFSFNDIQLAAKFFELPQSVESKFYRVNGTKLFYEGDSIDILEQFETLHNESTFFDKWESENKAVYDLSNVKKLTSDTVPANDICSFRSPLYSITAGADFYRGCKHMILVPSALNLKHSLELDSKFFNRVFKHTTNDTSHKGIVENIHGDIFIKEVKDYNHYKLISVKK